MVAIIISSVSLCVSVYALYINYKTQDQTFEQFLDLDDFIIDTETRISELESTIQARMQNMQELSSRIDAFTKDIQQVNSGLQQIASFADQTRGQVDINSRRLDALENE